MVHVDCRATSDRNTQASPLARVGRPPALDFRRRAVVVAQTGPCLHQKMGSMRSHGQRTKYLSNVQNPRLIRRKRPHANLVPEYSNLVVARGDLAPLILIFEFSYFKEIYIEFKINSWLGWKEYMSFMKWWKRICTKLSHNKLLAKYCKHQNSIKGAYMLTPLILCLGTLDPTCMWAPLIIAIGIQNKHYFQIIKSNFNTHCNKNSIWNVITNSVKYHWLVKSILKAQNIAY